MNWKDTTSYSQREERIPSSWTVDWGTINITVHRHIHYKDENGKYSRWCVTCYCLNIGGRNEHVLKSKDLEAAKAEGIEVVLARLEELNKAREYLLAQK